MGLFYFNDTIEKYERELDFINVIKELEKEYRKTKSIDVFNTIIADSWYFYIEGDVNQTPKNYDWKFLFNKWREYIEIGLKNYFNNDKFCLIAGYTLILHGFEINERYEKKGLELLQKCANNSTDNNIKRLAEYFVNNENGITDTIEPTIIKKLFDNKSIIDNYFIGILSIKE